MSGKMCFDSANGHTLTSFASLSSRSHDAVELSPTVVHDNATEALISLLPTELRAKLYTEVPCAQLPNLTDINLDIGRTPYAWVDKTRIFFGDESSVGLSEIEEIQNQVGSFSDSNRAAMEGLLHRVSAMRNREGNIIGFTFRVGRHVSGNADMILDLLLGSDRSLLFLGPPSSGKTTIIRDVARLLSERQNVIIIDTSNEIAGDGNIPHACIGLARRMMVRSLSEQADVMVECVQNHSPQVLVVDEIGRTYEVDAASTCKQRGQRMVASAHGDFAKLIANSKLRGLVGGVERVTLGDSRAPTTADKLKTVRSGLPVFDTVIELSMDSRNEWRVIHDVAGAVDSYLEGLRCNVQRRIRDPQDGSLRVHEEQLV
jgi:stage III sporulation protein SpoIIIAA